MRRLLAWAWGIAIAGQVWAGSAIDEFMAHASKVHGDAGERAARFLVDHMPPGDRETLSASFLIENLDLAFQARAEFPWASKVPEEVFLNDVLPYAVFDERRDPWRAELLQLGRELVKDARTASEAAQALNRELFKRVNVHYNTGRKRPNQSLVESKALGMATCTGLSVILVEACRAVGVPARAVGTPRWVNERGNHTWVEVWDGDWHFTGADEYDAAGLNRGWFTGDAARAQADSRRYGIFATSWKRDGVTFPMVWARDSTVVAAVNVTSRYARPMEVATDESRLGVRLWDRQGGERLSAKVCVLDGVRRTCAAADTRSGTADLNDLPRFSLKAGAKGWLRFTRGDESREMAFGPIEAGDPTLDVVWSSLTPVTDGVDLPASNGTRSAAAP